VSAESQQEQITEQPALLRVDDLLVDLKRRSVKRGSEILELPDRSFRLLAALLRYAPETVGKDQLIAEVWDDAVVSDETLAQRVRLLRQSLGDDSQKPRYIASVRGRGYRLTASVGPAESPRHQSSRKFMPLIIAAVLLAGLALAWLLRPAHDNSTPESNVLAVLPFADLSADQDQQFFADGMHEELLSRLAMIDGLAVISRTSVERYRGTAESLPDIGEQLGADAIIEGSIRVDGDRLRVTVQFIDAVTDEHLWAANFDRQLSVQDIFELQTEVANQIAEALRLEYSDTTVRGDRLPTAHIAAYNYYLLGRFHTFKQTRKDLEDAVTFLEQAIDIDPEFADAYAALGWAYSFLGSEYSSYLPDEMYPKAKEAAIRAIALDADLANARSLYADILTWYDWDFVAAEREFKKTIELDPLNVLGYALFLSTQERHDEAVAMIERRLAAGANDSYVQINAGWRYLNAGQTDKAIAAANAAGQHRDRASLLGMSKLAENDPAAAIEIFETEFESQGETVLNAANLAIAYYRSGRLADAEPLLAELEEFAVDNYVGPGLLANVYFAAGDADQGFAMLEQAFELRARAMIFLQVNQMLHDYREDPRYLALIERVGFL